MADERTRGRTPKISAYFRDPHGIAALSGSAHGGSGEALTLDKASIHNLRGQLQQAMQGLPDFKRISDHVLFTERPKAFVSSCSRRRRAYFLKRTALGLPQQQRATLAGQIANREQQHSNDWEKILKSITSQLNHAFNLARTGLKCQYLEGNDDADDSGPFSTSIDAAASSGYCGRSFFGADEHQPDNRAACGPTLSRRGRCRCLVTGSLQTKRGPRGGPVAPFAGIAFLWLIGVLRARIGVFEDRFFTTVFLGSGLLFVASLFASAAFTGALVEGTAIGRLQLDSQAYHLIRYLVSAFVNVFAMKMAGVFIVSTSTIILRTSILPRWIAISGYACATVLLLVITSWPWIVLLFPLWMLILSVRILIAEFHRTAVHSAQGA